MENQESKVVDCSRRRYAPPAHFPTIARTAQFALLYIASQPFVHLLQIGKQNFLRSPSPTFAKAPKIQDQEVVAFAHKILGEFAPTLDTPGVTFNIKTTPLLLGTRKCRAFTLPPSSISKSTSVNGNGYLYINHFGKRSGRKKK